MIENEIHSYKDKWVMSSIRRAIDSVAHQITYTNKVERRILSRVGRYLAEDENHKNNRRYIGRMIYQEISAALKRNSREYAEYTEDLSACNEEGQTIEYEHLDVLANVGSGRLEIKETITLLAKDDRRRKLILTEWMNGNTNDSDISSILADTIGGQARSHRIFVQRFRIECREQLATAM